VVAEACIETNDLSDHDRRVLARSSAKFASEVFQFTLTCSHGPIFICFVCVTGSPVAVKQPHLQSIVQQMFSKQLPAFPHSDGTVLATIPAGRQPSRKFTPNSINTSAFTATDRGLLRSVLGPWSPVPKCEAPGAPISVEEHTFMAPRPRRQRQNPPLQKSSAIPA